MTFRAARPRWEALRLWWICNGQIAGLAIAVAGGGAVMAAFIVPTIATTSQTGVVTGFVTTSSDTGTGFNAIVEVEGRRAIVPLSVTHRCFAGAPIKLRKTRTLLLGDHYAADGAGCDQGPTPRDGR